MGHHGTLMGYYWHIMETLWDIMGQHWDIMGHYGTLMGHDWHIIGTLWDTLGHYCDIMGHSGTLVGLCGSMLKNIHFIEVKVRKFDFLPFRWPFSRGNIAIQQNRPLKTRTGAIGIFGMSTFTRKKWTSVLNQSRNCPKTLDETREHPSAAPPARRFWDHLWDSF